MTMEPSTKSAHYHGKCGSDDDARIDAFLYDYFLQYARELREHYPGSVIRNAAIVRSALCEFSDRGLITLVKASEGIPTWLPSAKVKLVKTKGGQPIWMPTEKLIRDWIKIFQSLRPALRGGSLCWSVETAANTLAS